MLYDYNTILLKISNTLSLSLSPQEMKGLKLINKSKVEKN